MATNQSCAGCSKSLRPHQRSLVVREPSDLSLVSVWWRRYEAIYIRLPLLTPGDNAAWEDSIQKAYSECGCTLGAYCLAGAVAIVIVLIAVKAANGDLDLYGLMRFFTMLVIGSVVVGKLIGILIGRVRAAVLVERLRKKCQIVMTSKEQA